MPVPVRPMNIRVAAAPAPSGPIVSESDLTWIGSFIPPHTAGISMGLLAARRVAGELRFFNLDPRSDPNHTPDLIEYVYPGIGTNLNTLPRGTALTHWGDIFGSHVLNYQGNLMTELFYSQLFWDDVNQGIYWQYTHNYNVSGNPDPSIGFTALTNPSGPVITISGPWRCAPPSHQTHRWIGRCPQAFADAHVGGQTLLVGGIGTSSGNASSSWGPCLFAPDQEITSSLAPFPTTSTVPVSTLVGYSLAHKAPRESSNWVPHGSPDTDASLWSQIDGYAGTGVWMDTPSKSGVLFLSAQGTGHVWYGVGTNCGHGLPDVIGQQTTGPHCSAEERCMVYVYDPDEFVRVLTGQIQPYQAAWASAFDLSAVGGFYGHGYKQNEGMWFDPVESRLYVTASQQGAPYDYLPIVNVYQVAG